MKNLKIIPVLFCITALLAFNPIGSFWQKADPAIVAKELREFQKAYGSLQSYSVALSYTTYDTKKEQVPQDKSDGYIIRSGSSSKSRLLGIYSVQNEKLRVTIDSLKKIVHVANAFKTELPNFSPEDYLKILGYCKSVQKGTGNKSTSYRFETKNTEGILAQEVFLENGLIKEANIYYANEHTWREDNTIQKEMVYPRLQVLFKGFNSKLKLKEEDFSIETILSTKEGKKLQLAPGFNAYKLIDGRIKK